MGMDLSATEIVVLSACDTGRGAIHSTEGVMGIRRAFQLAGAQTVVASLWKLPDEETALLMESFYRRLARGMSRVNALRAAQLELRQRFSSPFYWGAFVCFGKTTPVRGMESIMVDSRDLDLRRPDSIEKRIGQLNNVLAQNPGNGEALLSRGIAHHNLGEPAKAVEDFSRALPLLPESPLLYYSRGFSYHVLERYADALRDFNRAIELEPDDAQSYHRRGNTWSSLGNEAAALEDLNRAVDLEPENVDLRYDRAGFHADRGQNAEALSDYTQAIRLRPGFEPAYVNRASVYLQTEAIPEAIADLEKAIELDPLDSLALLNLGSANALAGDTQKAIERWQAAARLGDAQIIDAARQMIAGVSSSVGEDEDLVFSTLPRR
jgi:tetratricopeptide (TPR) repeat protein